MLARSRQLIFFIIVGIGTLCFASTVVNSNEATSETVFENNKATAIVYMWQQNVTGDWQSPSNWTPERISPASTDILKFNGGGTTTATNLPSETIGQLVVSGNTIVNLHSTVPVVLTIAGGDGDDLIVAANSAINFDGSNAITADVSSGATGSVEGSVTFSSPTSAAHRLTALDANAITFGNGAVFTAGSGFTGNPFGTTNFDSVIFDSGSTYISIAGGDPFGATEPASVVTFKQASLFSLRGEAGESFSSGRTYANFELNYPSGAYLTGTSALVMDDLTITTGRLYFHVNGSPGHSIKGNITVLPGAFLEFQTFFPGHTINLNGTAPQTIDIRGGMGVNPGNTLAVDNVSGVTVSKRYLAWNLQLINGVVTVIDPMNNFHAPGTVSRVNGYVDGRLWRDFSSRSNYIFDVGTANGYSPVAVNVTAGHGSDAAMILGAFQSAQPNIHDPSKALSRYWQMVATPDLTADLTFDYLDSDVPPTANEANFVIQRFNGTNFVQIPGVIDTVANTFTVTGVTDFASDWTLAEPGALVPPRPAPFDYDDDGRTDFSVFRPSDGAWYLQKSTEGFFGMQFGFSTDKIAPADYDGDGKTDIAIFRPSDLRWYIANSSDGSYRTEVYGLANDLPAPADYDGDGKADLCVFRPSDGTWYLQRSSNGSFFAFQFGGPNDKPTVGDFDGDGKSDFAVFRTTNGEWYQHYSSDGSIHGEQFGFTSDRLAYADYDGDGKTDLAIFRPDTRIFYIKNSATSTYDAFFFGIAEDIPTPGDYDGDGKADLSVFRPSDGNWYRQNSSNGSFNAFQFGLNGDRPTPTAYH